MEKSRQESFSVSVFKETVLSFGTISTYVGKECTVVTIRNTNISTLVFNQPHIHLSTLKPTCYELVYKQIYATISDGLKKNKRSLFASVLRKC